MLTTVMPRALAACLSTMSVPVAATAISLRSGSCAKVSARSGILLVMQMVTPFSRSTTSDGAVLS